MRRRLARACLSLLVVSGAIPCRAQEPRDGRTELPSVLAGGYFELGVGDIRYPFSPRQLEPGFEADSIDVPNLAIRVSLGHRFNERTSLQVSYLRPAKWVRYRNVNGEAVVHSVWMNVLGVALRRRVPVNDTLSIYGEGGLGIVTRHGFEVDGSVAVKNAVCPTPLVGAGGEYHLSERWGLTMGATFLPRSSCSRQPQTMFGAAGLTYRVDRPRRPAPAAPADGRVLFPEHLVQLGYTTSTFGYGFNALMSPIFWQGDAEVGAGLSLAYQRNVFHTERVFSIDWGASLAYHTSRARGDDFATVSVFPLLRFTFLRRAVADVYASYSLMGPTLISKFVIDGYETGRQFTFRDALGVGAYLGDARNLNVEVRIVHYSNGNVLPHNVGIQVPLTFSLGYAF